MIDNWSQQYRVRQANRKARGSSCAFPKPCPNGWKGRKPYPHPELLSEATPLDDLKLAVESSVEETCMEAIALLAKMQETDAVQILWNIASNLPAIRFQPSEWMLTAAAEEMVVHPVGYPALLDSVRKGGGSAYILGRKWGPDCRLVPEVEEAFLEVVRNGLNQSWTRSETTYNDDWNSGVAVTFEPVPQNGISFSISAIGAAFLHLGRGKTAESLQFLLTNAHEGIHEWFRSRCWEALKTRARWDPEAADALIEKQKRKDPTSIYHFCTLDEARDYECYARPKIREELDAKYDRKIFGAHKAAQSRKRSQEKSDRKDYIQRMKEQGRWFLGGELPKPSKSTSFFGEEKVKPVWAHWLDQRLFGPSGFIQHHLAFPFKSFLMYGWLGFALFVFALHTFPVLWGLDLVIARVRLSRMKYLDARRQDLNWRKVRVALDNFASEPWYHDHTNSSFTRDTFLARNPAVATLAALLAFVLTSPLLVLSVPFGLWVCVVKGPLTFRLWPRRW
jgi:hypothetical protein